MANEDILIKYKELESEINHLKKELNFIVLEKENWFRKKEKLKEDIKNKIKDVKTLKSQKDKTNIELQEIKKKKEAYYSDIKKFIAEIKSINKQKDQLIKKYNIKCDPAKIQKQIDELEKKVEIEVSFEKEKKLMDKIRRLKKLSGESNEVTSVSAKATGTSKKIDDLKKKLDELTAKISSLAGTADYDSFMANIKVVNDLRKEQENAFQKFIEYKNKYYNICNIVSQKLAELAKLRNIINKSKELSKIKKKEEMEKTLKEKTAQVEEKIKKGKKITTEDLIAFQAQDLLEK